LVGDAKMVEGDGPQKSCFPNSFRSSIIDHRIMDLAINFWVARNLGKVATALADALILVS
jgi:hypothetical protein